MSIIDFNKLILNKAGKLVSFTNHLKVCVPIAPEINGLPNVFLGLVNSKTDTSVNQSFKVKDNTKDYDGIKVVLSTALDDVLVTIEKNSTGEYNWDFPILEKGKTIAYYIYTYKDDKIGNYTTKHVYENGGSEPVPPGPEPEPTNIIHIGEHDYEYVTIGEYDIITSNLHENIGTLNTDYVINSDDSSGTKYGYYYKLNNSLKTQINSLVDGWKILDYNLDNTNIILNENFKTQFNGKYEGDTPDHWEFGFYNVNVHALLWIDSYITGYDAENMLASYLYSYAEHAAIRLYRQHQ